MGPVSYRIDSSDRLVEFGGHWTAFARDNGAPELDPVALTGHLLWDHIADSTTIALYQAMLERIRRGGAPIQFQFRCDAPDRRRLLAMDISAGSNGDVWFATSTIAETPRPSVTALEPGTRRGPDRLNVCAWCKRACLDADRWVEIEAAVDALALFDGAEMPLLSHGVCPACLETLHRLIDDSAG